MGVLLGLVDQVVRLNGHLVGVARLVLGHLVVRVVRVLSLLLVALLHGEWFGGGVVIVLMSGNIQFMIASTELIMTW